MPDPIPRRVATPELLAPAGSPEAARAALQYGADAIYLGLPSFSARAEAVNFTWEELDEIIAYAHALDRPRKVYVAMNTLLLSRELGPVVPVLRRLAELQADALIVQDAGLVRLARRHAPDLALHASTQMTVHHVDGVRALAGHGFTRVVPARELTLDEIGQLVRHGGLEVEIFIHGTLCYAYSGQCLFSSHATGRSGNRGRCTYGCRTLFSADRQEGLPFSMKDLALGDRLDDIRRAGVASLKIEGRMKSPLYVAAVTDYYRGLLDGTLAPAERPAREEDLRTIFSRPWTRLHADGRASAEDVIDGQTTGHRGARIGAVHMVRPDREGDWLAFTSSRALELHDGLQIDLPGQNRPYGFAVDALRIPGRRHPAITLPPGPVEVLLPSDHAVLPAGAPVYCASSQAVKRRYPVATLRPGVYRVRHPVAVSIQLTSAGLAVHGRAPVPGLGEVVATVRQAGPFAAARQPETTPAAARKAFERLGDTSWQLHTLALEDQERCFVPASVWNEARRNLADALTNALVAAREPRPAVEPPDRSSPGIASVCWSLRLDAWSGAWTAADVEGADEVVLPVGSALPSLPVPVRLHLPLVIRPGQEIELHARIRQGLAAGIRRWEVSSLAGWEVLRRAADEAGLDRTALEVSGDWPLHVLNPQAADFYTQLGLGHLVSSPEDEGANLAELLACRGDWLWVLVAQYSPLFMAATGPAGVAGPATLRSRGQAYVELVEDHQHVLVSRSAFWLAPHVPDLAQAGASGFRVDLARASAAGADPRELWKAARRGEAWPGSHEGNYRRGLK